MLNEIKTVMVAFKLPVIKQVIEVEAIASTVDMVTIADIQGNSSTTIRFFPLPGATMSSFEAMFQRVNNLVESVNAIGGTAFFCELEDRFVLSIPTDIVGKSLILAFK